MNYLTEINAFEKRMRRRPLPATAQLLWYKLMHFANRLYWPEWFAIDNERLAELLGVSTPSARAARDALLNDGLIECQRGTKMHPNQYHLVSIAELEATRQPDDGDKVRIYTPEGIETYSEDVDDITRYFGYTPEAGQEAERTAVELYKIYLPGKQPDTQDVARVFHAITDKEIGECGPVLKVRQAKKELLAYAFEQASLAGAVNWNYINGIYKNFHRRGITTIGQAYDYDMKRADRVEGKG